MGFFIVRPEFRGRELDNTLWHARRECLLAWLHPGASIGLDGVLAMQDYYAKGGFVFSHRNLRFRAEVPERPITSTVAKEDVVPLAQVPFDQILAYDRLCFPALRATFLKGWLSQPNAAALGCRRDGNLSGYEVVRRCGQGCKICPLFADDIQAVQALYAHLVESAGGGPLFLDAPENNPAALELGTPTLDSRGFRLRPVVSGPGPGYRPPAYLRHHHL